MKINEIVTEAEVQPYEREVLDTGANSDNNYRLDKLGKILRQFCPAMDDLFRQPICRGFKNHDEPVLKINPASGIRKSNNTTNYYTEFMDNSPFFKGWPMRSRSLICATDFGRANSYAWGANSATYAVFPCRQAKVAVCPGEDIWDTEANIPFFGGYTPFPDINVHCQELGLSLPYEVMVKQVQGPHFAREAKAFAQEYHLPEAQPFNFIPVILEAMSPENTGFQLMSVEEFAGSGIQGKELWIGDPVIIVRYDIFEELQSMGYADL